MDFYFTPTGAAMVRQAIKQRHLVLLRGKEIRTDERSSIAIAPMAHYFWILATPGLEPSFLLRKQRDCARLTGNACRVKMIAEHQHDVNRSTRHSASHALPHIAGLPA